MPAARKLFFILVFLAVPGCFSPDRPARCALRCSTASGCPSGDQCLSDGFCHATEQDELCPGGMDSSGDSAVEPTFEWKQLSAGGPEEPYRRYSHTCGIGTDDQLYCWGDNRHGQVGHGVAADLVVPFPRKVAVDGPWLSVSAGGMHTCAIRDEGELYCWGRGTSGAVGDGSDDDEESPSRVGQGAMATGWTAVAAGGAHTCGIHAGAVYCWGEDYHGQLGDGTSGDTTSMPAGVMGGGTDWRQLSAGSAFTCGLRGTDDEGPFHLSCWGRNDTGMLGIGGTSPLEAIPTTSENGSGNPWGAVWTSVDAGAAHACGIQTDGAVYCWGSGSDFALFNRNTALLLVPTQVLAPDPAPWNEVSAAYFFSCARSGTRVICAGVGEEGQNGGGKRYAPTPPVGYFRVDLAFGHVSAGGTHACGIDGEGHAYCWGGNEYGQIGSGSSRTTNADEPVRVANEWIDVAVAVAHACGVKLGGELACWGANERSAIGKDTDSFTIVDLPEPIELPAGMLASDVEVGYGYGCAIGVDDNVYCWGANDGAKLGRGSSDDGNDREEPGLVAGLDEGQAASLSLGDNHGCAVETDGELKCWGANSAGQIDPATYMTITSFATAHLVSATYRFSAVTAGDLHTCGIISEPVADAGATRCWGILPPSGVVQSLEIFGDGDDVWQTVAAGTHQTCGIRSAGADVGKLLCQGTDNTAEVGAGAGESSPVPVDSSAAWTRVAAHEGTTCGVRAGAAYCFGLNTHHQLGSRVDDTDVPTPVTPVEPTATAWTRVEPGLDSSCGLRGNELWCWGRGTAGQLGIGRSAELEPISVCDPGVDCR